MRILSLITVAIVISRYAEDLAWIKDHCFDDLDASLYSPPTFYVYNKGADTLAPEVLTACGGGRVIERRMENVGLEAGPILEHILREYSGGNGGPGLADVIFFKQGDAPGPS